MYDYMLMHRPKVRRGAEYADVLSFLEAPAVRCPPVV